MAKDDISHTGIVRSVGPGITEVEIVSKSACASCHAAGLCTSSEAVQKVVEVPTDTRLALAPGEEVEVILTKSMGGRAVVLAYVVPLFILMILAVSLCYIGVHELIAGGAGICGIAVWYLIVWLFRDRISRGYVFYIKRK